MIALTFFVVGFWFFSLDYFTKKTYNYATFNMSSSRGSWCSFSVATKTLSSLLTKNTDLLIDKSRRYVDVVSLTRPSIACSLMRFLTACKLTLHVLTNFSFKTFNTVLGLEAETNSSLVLEVHELNFVDLDYPNLAAFTFRFSAW